MKWIALPLLFATAVPRAFAAEASCGRLQRCLDYFQQQMCIAYDGIPAALTQEEQRMHAIRTAMEAQHCAIASRMNYEEECKAVEGLRFDAGEAQDCQALEASLRGP